MATMTTCRVCKGSEGFAQSSMIKYSVRHYAHPECALKKWGAEFFDRLTTHQLEQFPYLAAKHAGLAEEMERRLGYF